MTAHLLILFLAASLTLDCLTGTVDCGLYQFLKNAPQMLDVVATLWTKIGNDQANQITQKAASDVHQLLEKKKALAKDIEKNRIGSEQELDKRLDALKKSVEETKNSLMRFDQEINAAMPPHSDDMTVAIQSMSSDKLEELGEVKRVWTPNDVATHDKAALYMGGAMRCLTEVNQVFGCLKTTVENHSRDSSKQCTTEEIQKAAAQCKPK
jgi:ABC-type phosphate transport system auxiliary subunit